MVIEMKDARGKIKDFVTNKCIKLDDGQLYGSFMPFDEGLNCGDLIQFKYKTTEGKGNYAGRSFNNIVDGSLEVISQAPKDISSNYQQPVIASSQAVVHASVRDTTIVRQNALSHATALVCEFPSLLEEGEKPQSRVMKIAEDFEKWVFR